MKSYILGRNFGYRDENHSGIFRVIYIYIILHSIIVINQHGQLNIN